MSSYFAPTTKVGPPDPDFAEYSGDALRAAREKLRQELDALSLDMLALARRSMKTLVCMDMIAAELRNRKAARTHE